MTAIYRQCGLLVRSEFELALPLAGGQAWDVDVRWGPETTDSGEPPPGEVVAVCETPDGAWYTATETNVGYLLRFSDCGEFFVSSDLSRVEVRPAPTDRAAIIPILTAGTVLAFLLTLRGETVLHASAVAVGDRALAFTGHSGQGKSTVAALLCAAGHGLIADDVLAVRTRPARCLAGASELRLRAPAATIVTGRSDLRTRTTEDDRVAFAPRPVSAEQMPLAGIVVPSPSRTAARVEIDLLEPSRALFLLLALPRVFGWRRPDVLSRDFGVLSSLVSEVPVHNVTIPWGPPFDSSIAATLATLATGSRV